MDVLEIAKWRGVFETTKSRSYAALSWISCPVTFNSTGFQDLLDRFEPTKAAALYGCWQALCQLAAQHPDKDQRGVLCGSKGEPYTITRIARLTGFPAELFEELIPWALSVEWLIQRDLAEKTEQDRSETVVGPQSDPTETVVRPQSDPTGTAVGALRNVTFNGGLPNKNPPPPPPYTGARVMEIKEERAAAAVSEDLEGWAFAAKQISAAGVSDVQGSIRAAKSIGRKAADVIADAVAWTTTESTRFDSPAALAFRVSNGSWPRPTKPVDGRSQRERLERRHGAFLASLSPAAERMLCEAAGVSRDEDLGGIRAADRRSVLEYLERKEEALTK